QIPKRHIEHDQIEALVPEVVLAGVSADAVANAQANIEYHGLAGRCRVHRSDLFESLGDERFDLIMFNMPFWYLNDSDDALEFPVSEGMLRAIPPQEAFVDVGYGMIRRFMSKAASHLNPGGVIRCSFASFGNFEALDEILRDFDLKRRTVAETVETDYDLKYLAFEVTPEDLTP
ncbi:MAG: methyltransferase, partial [Myxococcota bacterium]